MWATHEDGVYVTEGYEVLRDVTMRYEDRSWFRIVEGRLISHGKEVDDGYFLVYEGGGPYTDRREIIPCPREIAEMNIRKLDEIESN